jgi:hypothetical protein
MPARQVALLLDIYLQPYFGFLPKGNIPGSFQFNKLVALKHVCEPSLSVLPLEAY